MPAAIEVHLPTFYPAQVAAFNIWRKNRFVVGRCGRRWGKTDFGKVIAVDGAVKGEKIGWFAPNYKIQTEAYAEIATALRPVKTESSEMKGLIRTTAGGRIDFWTTNDPLAGRSRHYHKVIMDEAAFMKENAIDIWNQAIEPTLYDYTGKVLVISNTNGVSPANFLHMLCEPDAKRAPGVPGPERGFVEFHGTIYDNPHLPKRRAGESDADHAIRRAENIEALRKTKHPLVWRQEYLAEFVDFSGDAFFLEDYILLGGKAVPYPLGCDSVYAVIDTAMKSGKEHDGLAVVFFAIDQYSGKHPITILDWDITSLDGSLLEAWLPNVFRRLEELAKQCGARAGSLGAWIEDKVSGTILLQQGRRKGWSVHEIESELTSVGKDERAVSVSGYVVSDKVKISEFAFDKGSTYKEIYRNHFRAQVLGFRVGAKGNQADDLLDCFTYGIAIGLGNQDGY